MWLSNTHYLQLRTVPFSIHIKNEKGGLFLFFYFLLIFLPPIQICAQSNRSDAIAATRISKGIILRLDSLQKKDNLEEWLYTCIDQEQSNPADFINFLSAARSSIWRPCKTDQERLSLYYFLVSLGYWQMRYGNISRSVDVYEDAYRLYTDKTIPGADILEYVMKPLGNNYTRLGDYDRAQFIQEKALAIALNQRDSIQATSFYINLSTTAISKGDLNLARKSMEAGVQIARKDTALYGLLLSTLSEVLLKSKELAEAEKAAASAIKVLRENLKRGENTPYWLFDAYFTQGEIQKEKGLFTQALLSFQKGNKILEKYFKGERRREKAKLMVASGDVHSSMKKPALALISYDDAIRNLLPDVKADTFLLPEINHLYGENTLLDALNGKAKVLLSMNRLEDALRCFQLLFPIEQKLRREFFGQYSRQQGRKESRRWTELAIGTAYKLWKSTGKQEYANLVLIMSELSKSQLLLDEINRNLYYNTLNNKDSLLQKHWRILQALNLRERENMQNPERKGDADSVMKELQFDLFLVQKQVEQKYPTLELYRSPQALPTSETILANVPFNTGLIEFFAGDSNIYIINADKGAVKEIVRVDRGIEVKQRVEEFVNHWFEQGPANMVNYPQQYFSEAYYLYKLLWKPIKAHREFNIVIPDGIIGYLPMEALVTDSIYKENVNQWPFLIKKSKLYYSYSLQTTTQLKGSEGKNFNGFFLFSDSSFKNPLAAVQKEYHLLSTAVEGEFYSNASATRQAFISSLPNVNLLHISTHAFSGEVPALLLADGRFYLFELYGKAFHPQLVVLGACRTGHGKLVEGEGIISMARGFTASGTRGIIAGLWNVDDESTANLIGTFYEQLRKNATPADALIVAKLKWIEGPEQQITQRLPYYWAGLVFYGNNERLAISFKKKEIEIWWWLVLTLILLLSYYALRKNISRKRNTPIQS